jgi:hypothetical protein
VKMEIDYDLIRENLMDLMVKIGMNQLYLKIIYYYIFDVTQIISLIILADCGLAIVLFKLGIPLKEVRLFALKYANLFL